MYVYDNVILCDQKYYCILIQRTLYNGAGRRLHSIILNSLQLRFTRLINFDCLLFSCVCFTPLLNKGTPCCVNHLFAHLSLARKAKTRPCLEEEMRCLLQRKITRRIMHCFQNSQKNERQKCIFYKSWKITKTSQRIQLFKLFTILAYTPHSKQKLDFYFKNCKLLLFNDC